MQIIKSPFKEIGKTDLGIIKRPFVNVSLLHKERKEWWPVEMLADSGADYTMLPKRYADNLGIDLNIGCSSITTSGIGGAKTVYIYKGLEIKIGNWRKKIPVGFLERDDVPPLLGRLQCLEVLEIIFKKHQTIFKS
ncbi:retroviral-like aspartic protease family protein [Patescibacteria group bacterium]|nr:retroviral-like aspartic protease family protein [Patescibacteria group bacterium]